MSVSLLPQKIFLDMFRCLGLGLLAAFAHSVLCLPFKRRSPLLFFCDMAALCVSAVLLQGYAAGRSLSGVPRGYMAFAMLLGAGAYYTAILPLTDSAQFWLRWLASRPVCLAAIAVKAMAAVLHRGFQKIFARKK